MTEHTAHLAHHFQDPEQQHEAAVLGMWTFLATEVLFFGALILGYTDYRLVYPDAWRAGSHHLKELAGAINTAVLLCSSLTMALAVRNAQLNHPRQTTWFLLGTIALGLVFLGIKAVEYRLEWEDRLVPRLNFDHTRYEPRIELFMSLYFIMTGLHAIHMIVGISIVSFVAYHAWKGRYVGNPNWVENTGLYWHFVDIVWIFLFPLLYLVR
jgi:cytochrome c oxidase subunit 3